MKYILACTVGAITGALIGAVGMYFYVGDAFLEAASQMSYEISLSNDIRAIQILEDGNGEGLREVLEARLACANPIYKESLNTVFWQHTANSEKLLHELEQYSNAVACN